MSWSIIIHHQSFDLHAGGGDRLKLGILQISELRDLNLDLGSGHMAYCCAAFIDLYLQTNFVQIRKPFGDGQTYSRWEGTFETGFIKSSTRRRRPEST